MIFAYYYQCRCLVGVGHFSQIHLSQVLNQYLRLHFGTIILIVNPHFASSSRVSMTNLNHFFLVIVILLILSKTSTSLTYLVFDFILG